MSTLELKAYLHQIIANTEDENWLKNLLVWMQGNTNQDTFGEISPEVLEAINKGLSDIKAGDTVSHEEMKSKYSQWLSNN